MTKTLTSIDDGVGHGLKPPLLKKVNKIMSIFTRFETVAGGAKRLPSAAAGSVPVEKEQTRVSPAIFTLHSAQLTNIVKSCELFGSVVFFSL
jgi:hypothetical protein